jgi:cytochrome b subunit of formate dehydrogenase
MRHRVSTAALGLALAALSVAFGAGAAAAQECADCHDTKVPSPVHADLGCADCHSDVDLAVHPDAPVDLTPQAICSQCHDAPDVLAKSAHLEVSCKDCHGTAHEMVAADAPQSRVAPFNQVQTCGGCHQEEKVLEAYLGSVHARALLKAGLSEAAPSCSDCHGSHSVERVDSRGSKVSHHHVPETCGACHQGVFREWQESSAHGKAWQAGNDEAPVCTTCHASHEIVRPTSPTQRLKFPNDCGGCHKEELASYRDSFHGQATSLGYLTAATCADCHTPHANLPAKDPRSTVHPQRVQETCGNCHGTVTARFASFDPHSQPSEKERNAKVYWTWLVMTGLLFGVFGFFTVHALLWLQRAVVGRRRGELPPPLHDDPGGQWVRRFGRLEIGMHLVVIVTFLSLAATGLPLKFHDAAWAKPLAGLFGGIGGTQVVHRLAAVGTFGYFLVHVVYLLHRRLRRKDRGLLWGWRSLVPRPKDVGDLWRNLRWFVYAGPRPKLDRWTYWEKFDYLAVFWGVAVIGLSGLMLWLPKTFAALVPGWVLNVAHIVHSDEALLATGFIFIFHFFHTHLRPEAFPLDPVIFTGRIPLARFKEERPLEHARLVAEGKLEQMLAPPPTAKEMAFARIFGFTAVTIGLLLAVAIIVGLLGGGH